MGDHDEHAQVRAEDSAESSPSSTSTCGLSYDFADDVLTDAARGSDVLLQTVVESVAGALGWFFAQEKGGAAPAIEASVEEGGGEVQSDAAEETPVQTRIDENTIACGIGKASTPTKVSAAAVPITSEDTVVGNSSASSDNSNINKKEQRSAWPRSRTKLVGIIAVGLVLMIAIVVGTVIGTSGNSGKNASVEQLQGANTVTAEEADFYLSENDGGDMEVVVPSPSGQQPTLPTDRPSLRPTPASADDMASIEANPLPIDASPTEIADDIPTSFSFYVLGDVPYNPNQKIIVQDQILHLSEDIVDEDLFLIHVGDAMNAKLGCNEKDFVFMRDLLTSGLAELPSFIIPGDK